MSLETLTRAELEARASDRERMLREVEASLTELGGELHKQRERGLPEGDIAITIEYMSSQIARWHNIRRALRRLRAQGRNWQYISGQLGRSAVSCQAKHRSLEARTP